MGLTRKSFFSHLIPFHTPLPARNTLILCRSTAYYNKLLYTYSEKKLLMKCCKAKAAEPNLPAQSLSDSSYNH